MEELDVHTERREVHGGHGRGGTRPGSGRMSPRLYSASYADVAQLARASACHAEGRGFESHHPLLESSTFSSNKDLASENQAPAS